MGVDCSFERIPRNAAISILHFGRAVPLNSKVFCRNFLDDFSDLGACGLLVAGPDLLNIVLVRKDPWRQNAIDHRDCNLKSQMRWQHASFTHDSENEIRIDVVPPIAEPPPRITQAHPSYPH